MKKIIDQHGRLFGKISIIDVLVLLVVLAVAAVLFVKFSPSGTVGNTSDLSPITYKVTINGVRDYTLDSLMAGDAVYDKDSGSTIAIGTITQIETAPAQKVSSLTDGTLVLGDYEGRYDVTVTIEAEGIVSERRTLINKTYELNVNSTRNLITKYTSFSAVISEIG